jgi:hypothetical protein
MALGNTLLVCIERAIKLCSASPTTHHAIIQLQPYHREMPPKIKNRITKFIRTRSARTAGVCKMILFFCCCCPNNVIRTLASEWVWPKTVNGRRRFTATSPVDALSKLRLRLTYFDSIRSTQRSQELKNKVLKYEESLNDPKNGEKCSGCGKYSVKVFYGHASKSNSGKALRGAKLCTAYSSCNIK